MVDMPTRTELKRLSILRLKEAEALFDAGFYDGTAYLCGYAVELALKARICKLLGVNEYPPDAKVKQVYAVHDFEQLLLLSGLKSELTADHPTYPNWSIASPWKPEQRYDPKGTYTKDSAGVSVQSPVCSKRFSAYYEH